MKKLSGQYSDNRNGFSAAEHLLVQQEIEHRANSLWRRAGCAHGTALSDWVKAEREIVRQFCDRYRARVSSRSGQTRAWEFIDHKRSPTQSSKINSTWTPSLDGAENRRSRQSGDRGAQP